MYDFYDYLQGCEDFKAGKNPYDNPYTTSHEREMWLKGWYDTYISQIHTEYAGTTRFIELKRKVPYNWTYR